LIVKSAALAFTGLTVLGAACGDKIWHSHRPRKGNALNPL